MNERIEVNPNVHFGEPCVAGTRIPVRDVLELLRQGLSFQKIQADYFPDLSREDLEALVFEENCSSGTVTTCALDQST